MTLVLLTASSFVGALLFGLLSWNLCAFSKRRRRNALAFALVGEITGILRLIETDGWEAYLRETARGRRAVRAKAHPFVLPRPVIFEMNAHALDLIAPSVVREVAQFHALLGGVGRNAAATANDGERAGAALLQLEEALALADAILRALKPLLNRHKSRS